MVLLINVVNTSNHTKCVSLSSQKCQIQPMFINLYPNEYSQEFHYYPFTVKLDTCVASCSTLNDLSNKVCVPNKTRDLSYKKYNLFDVTKFILVLQTFRLIQQSSSRTRC